MRDTLFIVSSTTEVQYTIQAKKCVSHFKAHDTMYA